MAPLSVRIDDGESNSDVFQDTSNKTNDTKIGLTAPTSTSLRTQKRLRRVLNKPENRICLDCSRPEPRWATIISLPQPTFQSGEENISLGGFCCLECSGAHRTLGTHLAFVRSVDLDSMKEEEIKTLEKSGNAAINSIYEGRLFSTEVEGEGISISFTKEIKPDASSDQKTREHFIKNKYSKRMYLDIIALNRFHRSLMSPPTPILRENSVLSPVSSTDDQGSPPQLQIFTSSPRTLAMLEKYMNPKPKKKKLTTRLRSALSFVRGPTAEGSEEEGQSRNNSNSELIVDMPRSLNVLETRSVKSIDDDADDSDYTGIHSDGEYHSRRRRSLRKMDELFNEDFDDFSVTSANSIKSAPTRRRWRTRRIKSTPKKKKDQKKPKKNRNKQRSKESIDKLCDSSSGEENSDKENNVEMSTISRHPTSKQLSQLAAVEEFSNENSIEQVYQERKKETDEVQTEHHITSWSRSVDKFLFRRSK